MTWPNETRSDPGYYFLLDHYPHAVSFLDLQGCFQEANVQLCKLTGLARKQLLGYPYLDHIPASERSAVDQAIKSALNGETVAITHRVSSAVGNDVDVVATFIPFIQNDALVGLYCVEENISAYVADQQALVDSERRYRSLFEQNPNLIYSTDLEGKITDVNSAAEAASGLSRNDLKGISIFEFSAEEEREALEGHFTQLKSGHSCTYEMTFPRPDGGRGELTITAMPIFKGDTVVGTHSIAKDVTEERNYARMLVERVKELTCIRVVTDLLERADNLHTLLLQNIAQAVQAGFQYPEITGVRISLNNTQATTKNFRESEWQLSEAIISRNQRIGAIDVIYLEQRPDATEGLFLAEERDLLHMIADKLQRFCGELQLAEELRLAADALNSTAEGVMVLDTDARVVMVNPAYLRLSGRKESELKNVVLHRAQGDPSMSVKDWLSLAESRGSSLSGEDWFTRRDGSRVPVLASISAIKDSNGVTTHYVVVFRDISAQKQVQERLDFLSRYDALTQLPNRTQLAERGAEHLVSARRHNHYVAMGFLDLDRFKHVNDSLGRDAGNELLRKVGERLRKYLRSSDTIARLGGDEFALVLPSLARVEGVRVAASQIIKAFHAPFEIAGHEVAITASLGMAIFPVNGDNFETLLRNAEIAMYNAKEQGRVSYRLYSPDMEQEDVKSRALALRTAMHRALDQREFLLHYQPIVNLGSGRITGMEALIRWHSKELGDVSPSDFIPLAEETGLIYSIGEWVLQEAVRETAALVRAGYKHLRVAVNLSARQFQEEHLVSRIQKCLEKEGLAPNHLELEITETLMMYNIEQTVDTLRKLHALGVSVALDDFGTGYSSLQYLKDFPIEYLKIDKSFVDGVPLGARGTAITVAIINMARALGIKVIAEGVEKDEQLAFLRDVGCEEAQGYLLSVPLRGEDFRKLLDNHGSLPVAIEDKNDSNQNERQDKPC